MSTSDHEHAAREPEGAGSEEIGSYTGTAVRGSVWSILQTAASKGVMLVVQWILALVLLPADFGLFAIALSTAAVLTVCSPLPLIDLLVQRGPGLGRALPNLLRITAASSALLALVIASSSFFFGVAEGQRMETRSGDAVTETTPIEDLRLEPPLAVQLEHVSAPFELEVDGIRHEIELPALVGPEETLGDYADALGERIREATGASGLHLVLDEKTARLRLTAPDGADPHLRSETSSAGSVLASLGLEHRSEPLTLLVILFALVPIIMTFRLPLEAVLRLQMRFGALAAANFSGTVGSGLLAITLGVLGAGSLALMVGPIAIPLVMTLVMIPMVGRLPRVPHEEREPVGPLLRDAVTLWIAQWVHTAGLLAPMFVLRYCTSSEEVGYYYFAWLLTVQIIALFSYNLSQAFTPIFSTMQNHPERLASAYLRGANAVSALTIPFMLGAAAISPILIPQVFSEKWTPAVPLLMILMLAQSFASTTPASASLLKGSGRYRTWFVWQLVQNLGTVVLLVVAGVYGSVATVAWVVVIQQGISSPIGVRLCANGHATWWQVFRVHLVPFAAASPLVVVGWISHRLGPGWIELLVWCPLAGLVSGALYAMILRVLDPERYRDFAGLIGKLRDRLTGRSAPTG